MAKDEKHDNWMETSKKDGEQGRRKGGKGKERGGNKEGEMERIRKESGGKKKIGAKVREEKKEPGEKGA